MISKEQLKHIDANALLYHIDLLYQIGRVEQMIMKSLADGLNEAMVVFEHKFSDVILEELDKGGYTYEASQISELNDGTDFYKVIIK